MRRHIARLCISLLILLTTTTVYSQGYTLSISPTSGPPGTTVSLLLNQNYNDARCFANGQQFGGASYTIPGNATGAVNFYCEAGTGEFYVRTNDASFSVIQPDGDGDGVPDGQDACPNEHAQTPNGCPAPAQPTDSDGDGVPDGQDSCPNEAAQTPNGCPVPAQPAVDSDGDGVPDGEDVCPNVAGIPEWGGCPDADGDGLTTQFDNCPDQSGPRENNGCPADAPPAPTAIPAQPTQPPAPQRPLPELPNDGACYVATQSATPVNVRETPSLSAAVVATMDPFQVYNAVFRYNDDGVIWFRLDSLGGWVAGYVTRQTAPCDAIPWGTPDGALDTGLIVLADVSLDDVLADCPEFLDDARELPLFIQNELLSSDDPCADVQAFLEEAVFGELFTLTAAGLTPETTDAILAECPERLPGLSEQLNWLLMVDDVVWRSRADAINELRCDVGLWDGIASEWAVADWPGLGYLLVAHCGFPSDVPGGTMYQFSQLYSDFPVGDYTEHPLLGRWGCGIAEIIRDLGPLTQVQRDFGGLLFLQCGMDYQPDIAAILHYADALLVDLEPVLRDVLNDEAALAALCDNPNSFIGGYALPEDMVAHDGRRIPPGMQDCPDVAIELSEYVDPDTGHGIGLGDLLGIVYSANPCVAARDFLETGNAPPLPSWTSEVDCLVTTPGGDATIFAPPGVDDFVGTNSPWAVKLWVVNHLNRYRAGNWRPCVEQPPDHVHIIEGYTELPRACHYVSAWYFADIPEGIFPRGAYATLNVDLMTPSGALPQTVGHRAQVTGRGLFSFAFYAMLVPQAPPDIRWPYLVLRVSSNFEHLGEVRVPWGDNYEFPAVITPTGDETLCTTGAEASPIPSDFDWAEVGRTSIPLGDGEEGDGGDGVFRADDTPARAADADSDEAGEELVLVTEIEAEVEPFIDVTEDERDTDRIADEDLTEEETSLRDLVVGICGIPWEPDGREIVTYLSLRGEIATALDAYAENPDRFCELLAGMGAALETDEDGTVYFSRDLDEEGDSVPEDVTDRVDRGELSEPEDELLGLLLGSCGLSETDAREVLAFIIALDGVDRTLEEASRDMDTFCRDIGRLAEVLETDPDGTVRMRPRRLEPDDEIIIIEEIPRAEPLEDPETPDTPPDDTGTTPDTPPDDTGTTPDTPPDDTGTTPDTPPDDTGTTPDTPPGDTGTTPDTPPGDTGTTPDTPPGDTGTTPDAPPAGLPSDAARAGVPVETGDGLVPAALVDPSGEPVASLGQGKAVFEIVGDDDVSRLYLLLANGALAPLTGDFDFHARLPSISPEGDRVAFIAEDFDGNRQLMVLDFSTLERRLIVPDIGEQQVQPFRADWLPDGESLLVTLAEGDNAPALYRVDLETRTLTRWIENAAGPAINVVERIIAFTRVESDVPNIYTGSVSSVGRPVTAELALPGCERAAFGADAFVLYLQCGDAFYRYDVSGIQPLVDSGIVDIDAGPLAELAAYVTDDGGVYLLDESTGTAGRIGIVPGEVRSFSWSPV